MKIRPLIGRLIRIGGQLHVNQPKEYEANEHGYKAKR